MREIRTSGLAGGAGSSIFAPTSDHGHVRAKIDFITITTAGDGVPDQLDGNSNDPSSTVPSNVAGVGGSSDASPRQRSVGMSTNTSVVV